MSDSFVSYVRTSTTDWVWPNYQSDKNFWLYVCGHKMHVISKYTDSLLYTKCYQEEESLLTRHFQYLILLQHIKDELHTSPRLHFIPPTHSVSNEKMKYGDASPLNNLDKWKEERWVCLLAANFGTSLQQNERYLISVLKESCPALCNCSFLYPRIWGSINLRRCAFVKIFLQSSN